MATLKSIEPQKQEVTSPEGTERTRECLCFLPHTDIYEEGDQIVIVADVPGANEDSVEVTLEKNILTINAYVNSAMPEGYNLTYAEYEVGDYQRSFRISQEIDRDKIKAVIKDGVLRLFLPKAADARTRKISVKAG